MHSAPPKEVRLSQRELPRVSHASVLKPDLKKAKCYAGLSLLESCKFTIFSFSSLSSPRGGEKSVRLENAFTSPPWHKLQHAPHWRTRPINCYPVFLLSIANDLHEPLCNWIGQRPELRSEKELRSSTFTITYDRSRAILWEKPLAVI